MIFPHNDNQIYFERQSIFSNNCAVHTVNNLIGFPAFSPQTFNDISTMLENQAKSNGFTTKTKHILGGDFDVNVIETALLNLGLQVTWVDSRKQYKYKYEEGTFPKGFILNFNSQENLLQKMLAYSNRHWVCLKLQSTDFYMLDSKKPEPVFIEDIDYFINRMREDNCKILEVRGRICEKKKESMIESSKVSKSHIFEETEQEKEKEKEKQGDSSQKKDEPEKQENSQKQKNEPYPSF